MAAITGVHSGMRIDLSALVGLLALAVMPGVAMARPASFENGAPDAGTEIVRDVGTGKALEDYWAAEAAEYRATAEAVLNSVGASYISRGSLSGSVLSDFLLLFGGGAGAPQDLVKLRPESASIQQKTVVK